MARLFGTDGVRGKAGQGSLTNDFVRRLGWATGLVLAEKEPKKPKAVFLVRDTRSSGPKLTQALSEGLGASGYRVLDGGVLPTPAVAALLPKLPVAAGAVISASHNPAVYNGVKLFGPGGLKLDESWEDAIERHVLSEEETPASREQRVPLPKAFNLYLDFLVKTWPKNLSLKGFPIVVDCAHGAAHQTAPELFRRLGANVTVINASPNGKNINHRCGALHPEGLIRAVKRHHAKLGVALDGDADRAMLVDEAGHVRDGDAVLLATARRWQSRGELKAGTVVVTVMTNLGLFRAFEALGIKTKTTNVGDKYVWQGMKETGAVLGGEPSGHIIFRDHLPTGDGLLTALQVLAVLAESQQPFSALTSLSVVYPQILLNVPVQERVPLDKIPGFSKRLQEINTALGTTGRTLIRYSGTEPLLRIMVEGPDRKTIESHAQSLAGLVK